MVPVFQYSILSTWCFFLHKIAVKVKKYAMLSTMTKNLKDRIDGRPVFNGILGADEMHNVNRKFSDILILHWSVAQLLILKTETANSMLISDRNCCRTEQSTYTILTQLLKLEISDWEKTAIQYLYFMNRWLMLIIYSFETKTLL